MHVTKPIYGILEFRIKNKKWLFILKIPLSFAPSKKISVDTHELVLNQMLLKLIKIKTNS